MPLQPNLFQITWPGSIETEHDLRLCRFRHIKKTPLYHNRGEYHSRYHLVFAVFTAISASDNHRFSSVTVGSRHSLQGKSL
jgi:hypothetical protein